MNATMTTTKTTTTCILAIDLGKYKSVACNYDPATSEAHFTTVATTRDELERLLSRVQTAVVVIEACTLTGWVYDLCVRLGLTCKVANTASEAWKFKHAKRKTDKDDALRLAQLEALGQLPTVTVPSKEVREWRSLIATRAWLVGRRVAEELHAGGQRRTRREGVDVVVALEPESLGGDLADGAERRNRLHTDRPEANNPGPPQGRDLKRLVAVHGSDKGCHPTLDEEHGLDNLPGAVEHDARPERHAP